METEKGRAKQVSGNRKGWSKLSRLVEIEKGGAEQVSRNRKGRSKAG